MVPSLELEVACLTRWMFYEVVRAGEVPLSHLAVLPQELAGFVSRAALREFVRELALILAELAQGRESRGHVRSRRFVLSLIREHN